MPPKKILRTKVPTNVTTFSDLISAGLSRTNYEEAKIPEEKISDAQIETFGIEIVAEYHPKGWIEQARGDLSGK